MALSLVLLLCFWITCIWGWTLKPYNPKANPAAIVETKEARFTILTANVIRMEYNPSATFEDRASRIFVNRDTEVPKFSVTNGSTIVITTDDLTLTYHGGAFSASSLTINGNVGNLQFAYSPSGDVNIDNGWSNNLFGTILALDGINGDFTLNCTQNYGHGLNGYKHPYCQWSMFGMDGYAVIDDANTTMMDNNWFSPNTNANAQDLYFFGHGNNYKSAIYDYTLIAGAVPLMPRYGLGSLHTRWYHYNDYSYRRMINDYESRSIPLDLAVIDMDWHYLNKISTPWGDYTWSNLLFPNPNVTQTWFHQVKNLRTSANIHDDNGIQTIETYYQQAAAALGVTTNRNIPPNISSETYMMAVQDILLEPISEPAPNANNPPLAHGFDVWWIDWQQGMDGIHLNPNITPTFILSYVRGTNNIRKQRNVRNMVLARCGGYGNHRYPTGFSGDQVHDWSSLQYNTYFTATAANVLFAWSHDIYGSQNSQDLAQNTRWIQFGAYSPIFRIHDKGQGTGGCALKSAGCALPDIWTHPYQYFDIERQAMRERAELLPYIYNASYTTYTTGIQLVRSMYIDFAADPNAYPSNNAVIKQQYMFGDAMIVSPIAHAGDLYNVTTQSIWLPATEEYYERHSGNVIAKQSSKSIARSFSLSEIPIYIKTGSIVPLYPLDGRRVLGVANDVYYDSLRFDVFAATDSGAGSTWLYEDDGITYNYLNNSVDAMDTFVQTHFDYTYDSSSYQFTANIVSKGDYDGFNRNRRYSMRIYNVLSPKSVTCNGNVVSYNLLYFDDFNKENTYYFDGVDMALTVNCPSTVDVAQTTRVQIEFARGWETDFKYTLGMKGKISRAQQCKAALDEVNYEYGTDTRANMSFVAAYSMLLGNIGSDYNEQFNFVQQFNSYWQSALSQVKGINSKSAGPARATFCNNLYTTI